MDISNIVLESLTNSEQFVQKAFPYLKEEYFEESFQKYIFRVQRNFLENHHTLPNRDTILIDIEKEKGVTENIYNDVLELTEEWDETKAPQDLSWLVENTEEWCKDRAFFLAVRKAAETLDESKKKNRGDLPEIMNEALAVSFDTSIGHNFFENWESRWQYYTDPREKIPFDLDLLNKMTEGGVENKTLNVIMGGIHSGKTRFLCHLAAAYASIGYNVIYFTMEMSEEKISHRIDANLLDIKMDDLKSMSIENYETAIKNCRKKTKGEVVVKEFPTGSAHVGHMRHVLKELKTKKSMPIDIVIVDYINICASARYKGNANDSYNLVKMISEELRGLGQEFDIPIWSATQVTRAAFSASDVDMDDVSESWGLPATCDWLGAIISDDTLVELEQFILKQLKSRYSDKGKLTKGLINYSNEHMRLTDAPNQSDKVVSFNKQTGEVAPAHYQGEGYDSLKV